MSLVQRTRSRACLLWFPVVLAVKEFDLFYRPFLPGGWCIVFTIIGEINVGKVLNSLDSGSEMICWPCRDVFPAIFVTLRPAILVFSLQDFNFEDPSIAEKAVA